MNTATKWLLGLCGGLVSFGVQAIPITATLDSSPTTITQTSQSISFSLDLSELDFDANTYSVVTSDLLLNFGFSTQGNPANSTVTLQLGSFTSGGTAGTLNNTPIGINPEWFDFTTGALSFGILRNNNSGTLSLNSASFSLALAAEPVDSGNGNGNGNEHSVPEPGTLALLGLGLFGLAMLGRRPRATATAT